MDRNFTFNVIGITSLTRILVIMKEEEALCLLLNSALLQCPGLLDELPQMMHAIDEGESIAIDRISDETKRSLLTKIMRSIPLLRRSPEHGWYKHERDFSARTFLLSSMLDSGRIIEPKDLSVAQQQATRSIPMNLMKLLQSYPTLTDELPILLDQVLEGNDVQLDSLGDEDLAEALERFLRSIGLIIRRGSLCIPDEEYSAVKRALKAVRNIFFDYDEFQRHVRKQQRKEEKLQRKSTGQKDSNDKRKAHKHRNHSSSSSESSSASSADSSDDAASNSENETTEQDKPLSSQQLLHNSSDGGIGQEETSNNIDEAASNKTHSRLQGPARPSEAELLLAAQFAVPYSDQSEDEDEDDDGFGPRIIKERPVFSAVVNNRSADIVDAPLGFVGIDPSTFDSSSAATRKRNRSDEDAATLASEQEGKDNPAVLKREEWLMDPGESKALNALEGGGDSAIDPLAMFGKSRKFQSGKQAKKNAEALIIQREYARSLQQKDAEQRRLLAAQREDGHTADDNNTMPEEVYEEDEDRVADNQPLSLMEEHLAKRQRVEAEKKGKFQERRPFDREKDVLARRKVGDAEMYQLVKNAKELTSRFDQPIVQKSFL